MTALWRSVVPAAAGRLAVGAWQPVPRGVAPLPWLLPSPGLVGS